MKNILKIILPAILLAAFSVQAQTLKIATVDMARVFTNFYKTKFAQADLDDKKNQFFKEEGDMQQSFNKAKADYTTLVAAANDQSLSQEERDKKKQAAMAQLADLQKQQATIEQYERANSENIASQIKRVHDKLLVEIRDVINAKAKAGGYNLVIDSTAETVNVTPIVLYDNGTPDLSDDVIKQLNIGAPIDLNKPDSAPASTPMSPPPLLMTNRF